MKITKHITFFYIQERMYCINNIIDETNTYEIPTDLFIHTNNTNLSKNSFNEYNNGSINIIYHDLSNCNPYFLCWMHRDLIKSQIDDYDIFIYIEDDMLVPYKAIKYWLLYNEELIEMNYNLGFVRIECENDVEYIVDLPGVQLDTSITLHDKKYCVNNKNPYCAFWIYNKSEFSRFINSNFYNVSNIPVYDERAACAIGLHGISNYWYNGTVIPIIDNKLTDECKIYHMTNNYVACATMNFSTIKFEDALYLPSFE